LLPRGVDQVVQTLQRAAAMEAEPGAVVLSERAEI
jgi:hypothetical protein